MEKPINYAEESDKLNAFLVTFRDEYDDFLDQAQEEGYLLADGLETLPELERYLLEKKVTFQPQGEEQVMAFTGCWFHLGEVLRRNFGGYWGVSNDDDNSANRGKWVLKDYQAVTPGLEFEPLGMVRRFIRNPKPGAFQTAISAHTNPRHFDKTTAYLNSLPDEDKA